MVRVTFSAYNVSQMKSILTTRLKEGGAGGSFDDGAVEFAARKTVGLNADVRRAFLVCRVAAEKVRDSES